MDMKLKVAEFAEMVGTSPKTIHDKIKKNGELPVNEKLITVIEKVNGRGITLIVTNAEQIALYKSFYGKDKVNNGNRNEILTDINSHNPLEDVERTVGINDNTLANKDFLSQILTVNSNLNDRYEHSINEYLKVANELADLKSSQRLLEDKAGREGFYLNEINTLEKDNNELKTVNIGLVKDNEVLLNDNNKLSKSNKWLVCGVITFFIISIISLGIIIGMICFHRALQSTQTVNTIEETVINDKKPAQVQEVVNPPTPVQAKKSEYTYKKK